MTAPAAEKEVSRGRDLLGDGTRLAVARYRDRRRGRLDLPVRAGRALDLGCGDGMEAEYLLQRGWKVDAVDLETHPRWEALRRRWKGKLRFMTVDAAGLGRKVKGRYDLVFEKDMLHHVPDPLAVLEEMKGKVKPGGCLAILECNRLNPVFYVHLTLMGNHQHFTRRQLVQLARDAALEGFGLKRVEARVWPVDSRRLQDLADAAQDLAERVAPLRPFLCYHLVEWTAPRAAKR